MWQLLYRLLFVLLTPPTLALVYLFISPSIAVSVLFLILLGTFGASLIGIPTLLFRMFNSDWLNYTFEIDSESIVRVLRSGKEDICCWSDLRTISSNGMTLSFVTEDGRVQELVVDDLLKISLTDFAQDVKRQIVANGKEELFEGIERRAHEEKIQLAKATQETSELRWHIYMQITPVILIAVGIGLYLIDGGQDILFLAPIGLVISVFGFLGIRFYRRNAERRLRRLEEQGASENDG